jgi:formylmethanofuran dehydrogenase subunit E
LSGMRYPAFFDEIPAIRLYDPLAEVLGAVDDGVIEYRYLDAVKLAGHSCPTVASAYWMTHRALRALYSDGLPERGNIRVEFGKQADDGVTGVIANVVGLLTGAAADGGFKGIAGAFDRRNKLFFAAGSDFEIRFTRLDTGKIVETAVSMQSVPASPRIWELLPKCRNGSASPSESSEFRQLWQERVRALLLDHAEDAQVFAINLL